MQLDDYLTLRHRSRQELCAQTGLSESTISRLIRGLVDPSWETMRLIEEATGGEVTVGDWGKRTMSA